MSQYLLAIDQGTTSSRAIVFDLAGRPVSSAQQELPQIFPSEGWVEHDPEQIWSDTLKVCRAALSKNECQCRPRLPPSASPTSAKPR
jgi:glycerol kinase